MTVSKSKAAETKPEDIGIIVPDSVEITVAGVKCNVRRLKTLEFLALLRVLTSGLGGALSDVKLDFSDPDTVAQDLSALMMLAIPNATEEFTLFLRAVVEAKNGKEQAAVSGYLLDNPDIDVLLDVFEAVATQEKDDLAVLAKKAQAMWSRVGNLYSRNQKK